MPFVITDTFKEEFFTNSIIGKIVSNPFYFSLFIAVIIIAVIYLMFLINEPEMPSFDTVAKAGMWVSIIFFGLLILQNKIIIKDTEQKHSVLTNNNFTVDTNLPNYYSSNLMHSNLPMQTQSPQSAQNIVL